MPLVIASKATSTVTVEGEVIEGLQSIEFRVKRRQTDIEGVGLAERIGVEPMGLVTVTGTLRVKSLNKKLDELLFNRQSFNMVAELKRGDELVKKITFDESYLDDKSFELGASPPNDIATTVYTFTSTRVREE